MKPIHLSAYSELASIFGFVGIPIDELLNERLVAVSSELKFGQSITVYWRKLSSVYRITACCNQECATRTSADHTLRTLEHPTDSTKTISEHMARLDSMDILIRVSSPIASVSSTVEILVSQP